jgi:hypothetical protein
MEPLLCPPHLSDNSPEEIIASRLLNQVRLVPDMPTKYSTPIKSETSKAEIMSQNRKCKQSQKVRYARSENGENTNRYS